MSALPTVRDLTRAYPPGGVALAGVSFTIQQGQCVGLVGESGSGKSTLVRLLLALDPPDGGEIHLLGQPLHRLRGEALRRLRRHVQAIFQDPTAVLNGRLPVWRLVVEPLDNFPDVTPPFLRDVRHRRRRAAARLLEMVGFSSTYLDCYPHELSGGQRQRVAIARSLSLQPDLLICDEPTANLDVSVQAQILNLLREMQEELGMACLFISHDMGAVRFMSSEILTLKGGRLVDRFPAAALWAPDRHPYTRELARAALG